jgi:serine/threonine protein kinase
MAFITDFGIATQVTAEGAVRDITGTPCYMAPEIFRGEPGIAASDLYSCGVVLHHMLAGRPPFGGQTFSELAHAHQNVPPDPIPAGTIVSPVTRRLLGRLLRKAISERPQSAAEALIDVEHALSVDALAVKTERAIALIVEEDPEVRTLCSQTLDHEGYHVIAADNAKLGMELAFTYDNAFILLDSRTLGRSDVAFVRDPVVERLDRVLATTHGLGFCRILRSDEKLRHVPVLLMASEPPPGLEEASLLMGATAVLAKPFTFPELSNAVRKARARALAPPG